MLGVLDAVTDVLLPANLDQFPHQVTVRTRTWTGGMRGADGGHTDADLVLPQKYPVHQVTTRDIEGSGGLCEAGDIMVEGIVPGDAANPGVGFTPEQLTPVNTNPAVDIYYVVTGSHNGEYALGYLDSSDTYEYKLVLRRRNTTPEVT